jgi:pyruvate dehydrogenase E1 component
MADNDRFKDADPEETREWIESLESALAVHGPERAHFLLEQLIDHARRSGAYLPYRPNTAYLNTIPTAREPGYPGDREMEKRIEAMIRWNAMAMVVHANRKGTELGGHIASYASSAMLYEVGFNHFWRAPSDDHPGDKVYIQGHSSPGIYARSYLEGRLSEEQLLHFREDVGGKGITSYPHPWLMPDYWQFPTVSMGLGPIMGIYHARYMRYLEHRGLIDPKDARVWCFLGDGEMDEPESLGAISLAAREGLDNLIFVVNCNLQRLDGPVRGNGKIIQELEADFLGSGWNVIKLIWGNRWDPLLEKDTQGLLRRRMEEAVDGEYQNFKAKGGAYTREYFFGKYPELKEMVANMSDEEIWRLNRGGHDARKVYAAYHAATRHKGQPTVILAKTVKGFGMGKAAEAKNIAHQQKKLGEEDLKYYRDRLNLPISDEQINDVPIYRPKEDSPEIKYMKERRAKLGGYLPAREDKSPALEIPAIDIFKQYLNGTDREISTTMAFVRMLTALTKDKKIGKYIVPIIPDEARTFGMDGLFRQLGIYSSVGQLYEPQDADQLMFYKEMKKGQILQEGITEAGAMSSWIAAATAPANWGVPTIPFYSYYSMFGFQRIGDFAWAAGDMQARGFLMGGTAGRTTLNGEGLQHQDGHSHILSSTIPNCVAYDPAFAYEMAVVVHDGLKRMYEDKENVFYYITMMNENYAHPAMPEGAEEGIRKGLYLFRQGDKRKKKRVQLLGSGTIFREVIAAAEMLEEDFGIAADIWSATSFTELRRDGMDVDRWNRLHPDSKKPRRSWVEKQMGEHKGPAVAATDYMRAFPDQIRPWMGRHYLTLGTDGFGRSDSRENLRSFFEVNRHHIVVTALKALADEGEFDSKKVAEAIKQYGIDPDAPNPATV